MRINAYKGVLKMKKHNTNYDLSDSMLSYYVRTNTYITYGRLFIIYKNECVQLETPMIDLKGDRIKNYIQIFESMLYDGISDYNFTYNNRSVMDFIGGFEYSDGIIICKCREGHITINMRNPSSRSFIIEIISFLRKRRCQNLHDVIPEYFSDFLQELNPNDTRVLSHYNRPAKKSQIRKQGDCRCYIDAHIRISSDHEIFDLFPGIGPEYDVGHGITISRSKDSDSNSALEPHDILIDHIAEPNCEYNIIKILDSISEESIQKNNRSRARQEHIVMQQIICHPDGKFAAKLADKFYKASV